MGPLEPPEIAIEPVPIPGPGGVGRSVSVLRMGLDIGVQIGGRAGNLILGIVVTAVIARGLGQTGYGEWTLILLVPSLIAYLNDLGLMQVAVRRAAADHDASWIGAMVTARALLSIPTLILSVLAVVALAEGHEVVIAGTIIACQALLAAPTSMVGVFQLQVRNDLTVLAITVNSVLWAAAAILLVHEGASLIALAGAFLAIAAITAALQAGMATRLLRVPLAGTSRLWRELARTAVPLSIGSVLILAYARIDGLIVYAQTGAANAGLYAAVYRIFDSAAFIPLSVSVTLLPLVSRAWPADPERSRTLLQLALDLLAMVALPALAFTIVAAPQAVELVYGQSYVAAAPTLAVLMGAFVLVCGGYTMGVYTVVLGLQRPFIIYAVAGLVLNLTANLIFVPRYGYVAAAWVTVATEMLVLGLIGRAVVRRLQTRIHVGRLARIVLVATVAGFATWGAQRLGVGVIGLLAITCAVSGAGMLVVGALKLDEIRQVLQERNAVAAAAAEAAT